VAVSLPTPLDVAADDAPGLTDVTGAPPSGLG
jgi:hypothetical protein